MTHMDRLETTDKLEVLGITVGVLLVLIGLGTISGLPWETAQSGVAAVTQVLGALIAIGIGVGIAWLTRTDAAAA